MQDGFEGGVEGEGGDLGREGSGEGGGGAEETGMWGVRQEVGVEGLEGVGVVGRLGVGHSCGWCGSRK